MAIRYRRGIHVLLAIGAGILMGAAFLDLLPEALSLGAMAKLTSVQVLEMALGSFLVFFLIDTGVHAIRGKELEEHRGVAAGRIAGALLIFHSFRDGMAIAASFAASPIAGYTVALGIGAHDFGDGLNTVLLTTGGRSPRRIDYLFLIADALAPAAGGVAAIWYFSSLKSSALLLAVAAGFFIQMVAGDLLPRLRHHATAQRWTVPAVLLGSGLIYAANWLLSSIR